MTTWNTQNDKESHDDLGTSPGIDDPRTGAGTDDPGTGTSRIGTLRTCAGTYAPGTVQQLML